MIKFMFAKSRIVSKSRIKKSEASEQVLARLSEYLEGNYESPMKWLVRFWEDQAAAVTYKELRAIVTDEQNPEQLFSDWFKDYSNLITNQMTPLWMETMENAWRENPTFAGIDTFTLDNTETNVVNWLLNRGAELVTNCLDDQKNAIRYIVAESHSNGMSSAETARYIRPTIGLTERQAQANLKQYLNVKQKLRADHPRMKDGTIERKAREASAKYAQKQQMYRAEMIARTEIAEAYNQGNDEAIRQAIARGFMPQQKKVWSTAHNGKVCQACLDLEGIEVGMDEKFVTRTGRKTTMKLLPPLHPKCKCAVMYVDAENGIAKPSENGTIKPTIISDAHSTPKVAEANAILDHIGRDGTVETRVFYNDAGYKIREITVHDHGNPKLHPYGEKGEHVHEYTWDKDGNLKSRSVRELTSRERKENDDIL